MVSGFITINDVLSFTHYTYRLSSEQSCITLVLGGEPNVKLYSVENCSGQTYCTLHRLCICTLIAVDAPRLIMGTLTSFGNGTFQLSSQFDQKVQYTWTDNIK